MFCQNSILQIRWIFFCGKLIVLYQFKDQQNYSRTHKYKFTFKYFQNIQFNIIIIQTFCQKIIPMIQKLQAGKSLSLKVPNSNGIQMNITYDGKNQLDFTWNFLKMKDPQRQFRRHYVILDLTKEDYKEIGDLQSILIDFYKHIKLGDFMKFYFSNSNQITGQIQKSDLIQEIIKKRIRNRDYEQGIDLLTSLKKCVKFIEKFNDFQCIHIVTSRVIVRNQFFLQIEKIIQSSKTHPFLNLLHHSKQPIDPIYLNDFPYFNFGYYDSFSQFVFFLNLRRAIKNIAWVKVKNAQINLKCNAHIDIVANKIWYIENQTLISNLFYLNNYTKYSLKLIIQFLKKQNYQFDFKFTFNGVINDQFIIQTEFFIQTQHALSIDEKSFQPKTSKSGNRGYHHKMQDIINSQFMHEQPIIISKKLSYQERIIDVKEIEK